MSRMNCSWLLLLVVFVSAALCIDNDHLPMDTAQVRVQVSNSSQVAAENYTQIQLWGQSTECWTCAQINLTVAEYPDLVSYYQNVSTQWPWILSLRVYNGNNDKVIISKNFTYFFHEHGVYSIIVGEPEDELIFKEDALPINTFTPLIVAACVLAGLAILWPVSLLIFHRAFPPNNKRFSTSFENNAEKRDSKKKKRIVSLDVFRGMCITVMIFVNYGGGGYWFFNHSLWNGLTVADLVFPWFIYIMGVAMPLSFQSLLKNEVTPIQILAKIIRRSIILFALGMFINNGQYILYWRIPGVLQRFAVAYLITGVIILFVPTIGKRQMTAENLEETDNLLNSASPHLPKYKSHFFPFALHWAVALILLAIWFMITFFLEVPGCPRGYIGPGGLANDGKYPKCTGGAAKYIDEMVFGANHIFTNPTCKIMYQTGSYDPEGLLGNLTSIFLCFLGVLAGRILQVHTVPISRIWRWLAWGVFFCGLAALLCKMSQNDGWIPINKNLWSASFVFLMGGAGFIVFSLCYVLVDVWKIWNGAPFIYVGMNSIVIYVGHETLGEYFPFSFATEYSTASHALALGSNILGVSSWVTIAYLMYRNSFFVNI